MKSARRREHERPGRIGQLQITVVAWLTLVWVVLWGSISPFIVCGGIVVSVACCLLFPMPRLGMHLRVRPLRLAWLAARFLSDVVTASVQVGWTALRFGYQPRNAVVEIDLRTDSDFVLTIVAEMVSLVPGSLVVEARRATHTLFLHVLDVRDEAGVEKMRRDVFALERRVILALGKTTTAVEDPRPGESS